NSFEKASHVPCWIDAKQPGYQRAFAHHVDEHALTQFESERVGVADGQVAGHRTHALHAEIGKAMRGDQIGATTCGHLGGNSRTTESVVNRSPGVNFRMQALNDG